MQVLNIKENDERVTNGEKNRQSSGNIVSVAPLEDQQRAWAKNQSSHSPAFELANWTTLSEEDHHEYYRP